MISTLLVAHPWFSPAVLCALVLLGPLAGRWLLQRPRVAWTLFGVSLLPVVLLTLVPTSREVFERCAVGWVLPTFGRVELMANVILLVPPVLLAAVAARRPVLALLGGVAGSAVIEAVQALVPALGRSCDTNDWLSNAIGALLGAALGAVAMWLSRRPRRSDDAAGALPGVVDAAGSQHR
ncbi:VanZ family protein [Cellulosimicrobium cellulans]|uniref:VanZ family protein n=1 Tax=Cellulosimicrobium cellulans TaxID=1710 RepID=UPI000848C46A|nr:VanZ family protein [Cellulosimicrobium cellulans]